MVLCCLFFFSSRRRHTRLTCDWSSDVCSSDLPIRGLGVIRVNLAIVFGVERAMCCVESLGHHRENVAVLFSLEAYRVVAAVGVDHALGKASGMDEFSERSGVMSVLLVERLLCADDAAHVRDGHEFRLRLRGITLVLRGISRLGRGQRLCGFGLLGEG